MLVRVKTPPIRIEGKKIPEDMIDFVRSHYKGIVVEDDDDELVDAFESDWYKEIDARTTAGEVVKILRTNQRWTQEDLARRLDIARSNVTNMENDKRPIGKVMARRLGDLFKVDYKEFLR